MTTTGTPVAEVGDIGTSAYRSAMSAVTSHFDFHNPLGLQHPWDLVFSCLSVPLWGLLLLMAVFCLWVLESKFLRHLPSTPILCHLVYQMILLVITGPVYTWLMQDLGVHVSTQQIYQCFILTSAHNFALMSSAWLVVFFITERGFSISQTATVRDTWESLHKRNRRVCLAILAIVAAFSVLGFVVTTAAAIGTAHAYPVCHPWWSNENTSWVFLWVWFVIFFASLVPSIFASTAIVMVAVARAKYKNAIRATADNLDRFRGLTMELKSKSNRAFSRSPIYLGAVFLITYLPLGIYIFVGPAVIDDDTPTPAAENPVNFTLHGVKVVYKSDKANDDDDDDGDGDDMFINWSYVINLSRRFPECLIWFICYSFGIWILPALIKSEVLFKRESLGRLHQIKRCLCCQLKMEYKEFAYVPERWEEGGDERRPEPRVCRGSRYEDGEELHRMEKDNETPAISSRPNVENKDDILPTPFLQAKEREDESLKQQ